MQDFRKAVWGIPYISVAFFPSLKQNFIAYRSFKVSDCIFEIHQLWQSGFSRVYSYCCYSCSFEAEIIKIDLSSHMMYSNNSEFSRVYDNFKCLYKKVWKLIEFTTYIFLLNFIKRETLLIFFFMIRSSAEPILENTGIERMKDLTGFFFMKITGWYQGYLSNEVNGAGKISEILLTEIIAYYHRCSHCLSLTYFWLFLNFYSVSFSYFHSLNLFVSIFFVRFFVFVFPCFSIVVCFLPFPSVYHLLSRSLSANFAPTSIPFPFFSFSFFPI